jgi:hypothetical protein
MEQNEHEKKENWQGALHSQWKEDVSISPALNWEQLSPHILKRNRKRIGWWWGMTFLLVGMLMSVLYFNISSDESAVSSEEFASASLVKNDSLSQSDQNILTSEIESTDVVNKDNPLKNTSGISLKTAAAESKKQMESSTSLVQSEGRMMKPQSRDKSSEHDDLKLNEKKKQNNQESGKEQRQEKATRNVIESSVQAHRLIQNSLPPGEHLEENPTLSTEGLIDSKPLYPLAIHTHYQIKIPAPMKKRKPLQFSYQVGLETGRSIRMIKGNYDGDGVQSGSIGARRWFLPKRLLHASVNWHWTENLSLQWGFQWGGGDIQSRWVFRNLSVEPNTQELRMQSSDGEVVIDDPSLIDQITNGNGGVYQLRLNYAYRMLTVPIGLRYRMTNQVVSPLVRMGWNWERIGRRQMSIDVNENGVIRNIPLIITEQRPRRSIQQYCALGLSMRLHERLEFYTEGIYYFPLTKMINANGYQVRSSGIGIQWGLQYRWH